MRDILSARFLARTGLLAILALYTFYSAGPFLWIASMSLRTTSEISANAYALPETLHWEKYIEAWTGSNYGAYFWNSTIVVVSAVLALTIIGAMAAHCLARYRFPGNRVVLFVIFSTLIFPPQITIISLFQSLVEYQLYDTLLGLTLVYIAIQLPLTVYILEGFFARIPQDLYDAAKVDGYSHWEIFWKITMPVGMPAIATTVILNFINLWNEFLYAVVLITDESNRTLPLGVQKFMGDQLEDIGMISTGLMIAIVPVIVVYAFFSEKLIQGMTAGAVK
ncbi:MAG: carbohydrate ABC transporter permease [Alphaproteobacteria bacterium]|nr:carbohydrate ABC transporter permease [Alphaproteobacteria bacterium]